MSPREYKLIVDASELARVAMGRSNKPSALNAWKAEEDPLAWWCLTEAIVALAKRKRRRLATMRFQFTGNETFSDENSENAYSVARSAVVAWRREQHVTGHEPDDARLVDWIVASFDDWAPKSDAYLDE